MPDEKSAWPTMISGGGSPAVFDHLRRQLDGLQRALLALAVQRIELLRELAAAVLVARHQQFERELRVGDAAGGVEARAEPVADVLGGERDGVDARDLHQRAQAGAARARDRGQAGAHEAAVLVDERRHVADGAERGDIEVGVGVERAAAGVVQRGARRGTRGRPSRARAGRRARAEQLRVDERVRVGQHGRHGVVVEDDHVHAELARARDLVDRAGAAVGGDEQRRAVAVQRFDGGDVQAVALAEAVGHVRHRRGAERRERLARAAPPT